MPLKEGKSKEAFSQNVKTEMDAGKPQDQALAIVYSKQGEKKVKKSMYEAQERPYKEDINDLIEAEEIAKGRGPDLQPRKKRGEGTSPVNYNPRRALDSSIRSAGEARSNGDHKMAEHHTREAHAHAEKIKMHPDKVEEAIRTSHEAHDKYK